MTLGARRKFIAELTVADWLVLAPVVVALLVTAVMLLTVMPVIPVLCTILLARAASAIGELDIVETLCAIDAGDATAEEVPAGMVTVYDAVTEDWSLRPTEESISRRLDPTFNDVTFTQLGSMIRPVARLFPTWAEFEVFEAKFAAYAGDGKDNATLPVTVTGAPPALPFMPGSDVPPDPPPWQAKTVLCAQVPEMEEMDSNCET